MNVLVINGSPKGEKSNTLCLTKSFVKGMSANADVEVKYLDVCSLQIGSCKGCFTCWKATPGKCCIADDMASVIEHELWADIIIWSFPLYYYSVPGALKNLIDRQLPMVLPFMAERTDGVGNGSHPARYDMSNKKHVIISTCGFYTAENNYDSVLGMFDHMLGKSNYETILCGQGELFHQKALSARTDEYLCYVEAAGKEYFSGKISENTRNNLRELLFKKEVFEAMADASWGIEKENADQNEECLIFTRQMAALYNKASYENETKILEMCYTDKNVTYQIELGPDGSQVYTDHFKEYTTRIETPFSVWMAISRGEMRGDEALMKQLYKVMGDFSLIMNWGHYFGGC